MKHLFVLNQLFWRYRGRLFSGVVFVFLANYFSILQPRMIRYALDEVVGNMRLYPVLDGFAAQADLGRSLGEQLLFFGGLVLAFAVIMGVFMFFMRWTIIVMSRLMEYDIRKEIYDHYQQLDTAFYKRNSTGDLMSRITEDVSKVRMVLGPAILYGINLISLFVLVIRAMIEVSPSLTLYSLLPLPVLSVSIYLVSERINRKSAVIQKQLSFLNTIAQEVYSGIRVVKSYVQESAMGRYFASESDVYKTRALDLARVDALFFPFMVLMIGISTIVTIYVGGLQVFSGQITTGNIGEFVIYVNMLTWPVTSIGWVASIVQQGEASQQRINEFLATVPALPDGHVPMDDLDGRIEFRNVTFTYPDTGITALREVSFELRPGMKMAVVGRTGSGKSTLAELILRMYDVTEGEILIDGRPVAEWRLADLRNRIGYVPQDVFLFSDTVAGNIAFGHPEADQDRIEAFAESAAIAQDIRRLPSGYDTLVGERGVTLSGGQKQRISLARALIKQPRLIILDDCLSAVDTDTEKQILQHLDRELAGTTAMVITHRITSMADYDLIVVLEHGRIIEQGTHAALLDLRGTYADLHERQILDPDPAGGA